ncbi:MAG: phosphoglucomutase [Methylophaga sp.]|nr:MAG: phosphoglucomutase [Methylophaga sp.]
MNGIARLLSKLGNKSVGLVVLIVSCLVAAAGFLWQQQVTSKQYNQQQSNYQQQTIAILHEMTASHVLELKAKIQVLATMPQLAQVLRSGDQTQIIQQQRILKSAFPSANKVCLIASSVDDVDDKACVPITFSVLSSLRQAKKEGGALMGVMHVGTENAYLLLTQRIMDKSERVVGVMAVALQPSILSSLFNVPKFEGYAELQQGLKKATVIANKGDTQWKKGAAKSVIKIQGTHWKVAYWPNERQAASSLIPMAVVVGVIVLMWLIQQLVERFFFKRDIRVIKQQLIDVKRRELKVKYQVTGSILQDVVDDIQDVALSLTALINEPTSTENSDSSSVQKKELTPESLTKRIEEREEDSPVDDVLEEYIGVAVDVDPSIFKAYDIRGIVGESLTEEAVKVIGHAVGSEALDQGLTSLVVGRDGRHSSPSLSEALIEGILASGCDVVNVGMVPTPLVYFAAEHSDSKSGIMVTGSHNPANYNGLKIVLAGKALLGDELKAIHQRIADNKLRKGQGSRQDMDVIDEYINRITSDIKLPRSMKVVIDCGNGVAGIVAPRLFKALGCEVIELYCDVDGNFPNHHPDPSQPDNLQALIEEVAKHDAELGLAFDGDGDRIGVVDTEGNPIWPDRLMIMFAQDVLLRMPGSVIIYDIKSSNLLGEEISRAGGEAVMWQSGHSVIKNKMQEMDAQLAGEMSGHIFFKERWFGFDDALYAASRLFELLCNDPLERTPTDIFSALPSRVSTPEILVEMTEKESKQFMIQILKEAEFAGAEIIKIDGIRADYPNGWGLVRASNTMPGLTLRFEADTLEDLQHIQQRFKHQMLQIKPTLSLSFLTLDSK